MTPKIIAHRGSSKTAPENTLAAFRRAVEDGADGIELDVRLTGDNEAVVFHDRSLERITGIKAEVSDLSLKELQALDAGSWFRKKSSKLSLPDFSSERISTLSETLELLGDFKGLIYIELKANEQEIERLTTTVSATLSANSAIDRITVKSFRLSAIPLIKMLCPEVRTAALFAPRIKTILRKEKYLVKIAKEFQADELSIHYALATRKLVKKAQRNGMSIAVWTVDNPRWVKKARRLGIDRIITNDPASLLARRRDLERA